MPAPSAKVEFYQPNTTIMKTKPRFVAAEPKDLANTSGHGYMTISYGKLRTAFGNPHDCTAKGPWHSGDKKVRAEWAFKSTSKSNPAVISIYDYKDKELVKKVTTWHVGAKGDLTAIADFLEKKLGKNCFIEHRIVLADGHVEGGSTILMKSFM